jgi:hypothetical protein
VYLSLVLVALVPPAVVAVTSIVPALPEGAVAVIWVGLRTATLVAAEPPNLTVVAPVKLVPAIATVLPPVVGPAVGFTPVTVGGAAYVYLSPLPVALVPPGVVTVISTVPVLPAGAVALIWVESRTATLVPGLAPKLTVLPLAKLVPVIAMVFPPAVGPEVGFRPVTVGGAA